MFEAAELGHTLDKTAFKRRLPALRADLLDAQADLVQGKRFGVVLICHGAPAAGRSEFVNRLTEWIDPRYVETHAFGRFNDVERERPPAWRFWQALPPRGRIGVFLSSWYSDLLRARVEGRVGQRAFDGHLDHIKHLERMLVAEGHLVVKLWFHLSAKEQRRRLDALAAVKATRWRVTAEDRATNRAFERFHAVAERALRETSIAEAPWTVIDGHDRRWREFEAGRELLQMLRRRLDSPPPPPAAKPSFPKRPPEAPNVLSVLDLGQKVGAARYEEELARWQRRLALLARKKAFRGRSAIAVFEGHDAAGKGGAIRRVTQALDQRQLRVVPIAAPTEEERARPYLWRFWRHVPGHGQLTIFDRSWYGRVLVERVEGFASENEWRRAYNEINEFEEELGDSGIVLAKFFLVVSPAEQLRRFRAREKTRFKRFKITADDWRNREKQPAYDHAICDMIERTSSEFAPWTLVEADDKAFARLKVLRTLCETIERAL